MSSDINNHIYSEDIKDKESALHIEERSDSKDALPDSTDREGAIRAEGHERQMSIMEGLRNHPTAVLWSAGISLLVVMEGYDNALLSNLLGMEAFREKFGSYSQVAMSYQISSAWQSGLGYSTTIGGMVGAVIGTACIDRVGYKKTILGGLIALVGCIFMLFFAPSVEVLFTAYILIGLPWGLFATSAISYASDVTPVALRPYLTTYINLCWIIGQFIAAGVILKVQDRTDEWSFKIPYAVQWIWVIPCTIIVLLAPESPYWLVRKGRLLDAEKSVRRLRSAKDKTSPADTVAMMVRTNQQEMAMTEGISFMDLVRIPVDRRRTEISCGTWATQAMCGLIFAGYAVYFFEQAGFAATEAYKMNLGLEGLAFVGTCLSWVLLTFVGRRKLMVTGLSVLALMMVIIGALAAPAKTSQAAKWAQAIMLLLWVFVYDLSVGPIGYAIVGEVSSTRLRAKTVGASRNVGGVIAVIAIILTNYQLNPTAWNWAGYAGFFWGGSCTVITVWAYFRLPEIKGRSFRELDILFERRTPAKKFAETTIALEEEH